MDLLETGFQFPVGYLPNRSGILRVMVKLNISSAEQ